MADFVLTQPPFDDLAVRRAVAFALDRRHMLSAIQGGYGFGGAVLANHYAPDTMLELVIEGGFSIARGEVISSATPFGAETWLWILARASR